MIFRLPVDIYQTARVVKVLLMMEKGVPTDYKGKSLSEIEISPEECIEEKCEMENEDVINFVSEEHGKY